MTAYVIAVAAASMLILLVLLAWASTLAGLPGNWIIAALAGLYSYLVPDLWQVDIGWQWVVAMFVLTAIGEALEFMASAVGTTKAGGSRRAATFSLIGSMIGGFGGMFVAMPIPVLGPLLGALFFGGLGAAVGAFVAETSHGSDSNKSWQVGQGAFWGRLLGTGAKTMVGCISVALVLVALMN